MKKKLVKLTIEEKTVDSDYSDEVGILYFELTIAQWQHLKFTAHETYRDCISFEWQCKDTGDCVSHIYEPIEVSQDLPPELKRFGSRLSQAIVIE